MSSRDKYTSEKRNYPNDLEVFLRRDTSDFEVASILRNQKKSSEEIEDTLDRLRDAKERLHKVVKKVLRKMDDKLAMLDIPDRVRKGMKLADKYDLGDLEKATLRKYLLDKHPGGLQLTYLDELRYTDMAKFLGFDPSSLTLRQHSQSQHPLANQLTQQLNISGKDMSKMNELISLHENTRYLYSDIKKQTYMYTDSSPSVITGEYKKDKHNSSIYINPVVAALFIPSIEALENRMLLTNIARMIISRAPDLKSKVSLNDNVILGELENELEFAYDIATDPNSLEYFSDSGESPVENLIKRFKIQVELWKNVLNLRQGKFYASGYDDTDSGVTGLLRILNDYDWAHFDSPDLYGFQDEGAILRKLLAVFSIRPTFVQLSSYGVNLNVYSTFENFARTTFIQVPIINVRLPTSGIAGSVQGNVSLRSALYQSGEWIMENRNPVPKSKQVIESRDLLFFYVNRQQSAMNFANIGMELMRFQGLPAFLEKQQSYNDHPVEVEEVIPIGNSLFHIKSVVLSGNLPFEKNILVGSSALIVKADKNTSNKTYLFYNPQAAGIMYDDGNSYQENKPISYVDRDGSNDSSVTFYGDARTKGTIFVYATAESKRRLYK